jgi:DNA-binding NtrC family response regulator
VFGNIGAGTVPAPAVDEWFARAARGTLFIDCIRCLDAGAQARLAALMSEQSCRINGVAAPSGDDRVRLITGNDRSLIADLAVGAFDDTLFYRLNIVHINHAPQDEHEDG